MGGVGVVAGVEGREVVEEMLGIRYRSGWCRRGGGGEGRDMLEAEVWEMCQSPRVVHSW